MAEAVPLFNSRRPAVDENARLRQEAVDSLHRALNGAIDGLRNIPIFLKECFEREVWKHDRIFAGGSRQDQISFHEFVHAPYPVGIGATYDTIRGFIAQDIELLAIFDQASKRTDGAPQGNQNARADKTTVDNIHSCSSLEFEPAPPAPPPRPTGTSAQAALRRLEKAVRENNERAIELHSDVIAGRISPHRAAINMGWRKEPTAIQIAMRAWWKMSPDEQEVFLDWASRN